MFFMMVGDGDDDARLSQEQKALGEPKSSMREQMDKANERGAEKDTTAQTQDAGNENNAATDDSHVLTTDPTGRGHGKKDEGHKR